MLPFIAAIAQNSFLTLVDEFFTRDRPICHFVESLSNQFKRTNVEKVFKGLFIAGPLHQKDRNFGHFIVQCRLKLFNLFVTTFLFNTVENKKDKITPTLRAILISCYCQETRRYKQ